MLQKEKVEGRRCFRRSNKKTKRKTLKEIKNRFVYRHLCQGYGLI